MQFAFYLNQNSFDRNRYWLCNKKEALIYLFKFFNKCKYDKNINWFEIFVFKNPKDTYFYDLYE